MGLVSRVPAPGRAHYGARRAGAPVAAAVLAATLGVAPLVGCSTGSGGSGAGGSGASKRPTTTTTLPPSASAYFTAMVEGGAVGALKMAAAAAPGSPARLYAEHLGRLANLGVKPAPPWATGTPGTTTTTTTATTTTTTTPTTTTAPPSGAPTAGTSPSPAPAPPASAGTPEPAAPATTPPPPPPTNPPPPRLEPRGDGFRVCSGSLCERYDDLSFTDGLVADFQRGGRPLAEHFAPPGPPVTHDGLTVQLTGASADALGRLVVVVRATNGSGTRWNLAYEQRLVGAGGKAQGSGGVIIGPSALDPKQAVDLAFPFPGGSLGGTVHLTTFLGGVSDPAAKVVYFDLPLG
ncbi:MAG: hypothetical protein IT197_05480 [Acidimicrobiia bacterium]|nr:hypothetical protein [Acidimicrobiia bacterium]